ncbi:MAG TPA: non-canonical purine NTP pyrophosphatase [Deltaproteobacteria bacterium]|nr:non-canonical purine NTP pyrophosphatase [Deltaproteobacteria bacterium]
MKLHFATSNSNKLRELSSLLDSPLISTPLDLQEIQTTDLHELVKNKLQQAFDKLSAPVIVEDTSLYFEAWNELPGPFVKWFLESLGLEGMVCALSQFEDTSARAVCCLGFTIDGKTMHFFEGKVKGYIVEPRGSRNFGWDSIFQPAGQQKTFGEMSPEEKQRLSPRGKAAVKFKQFLKLKVKQK